MSLKKVVLWDKVWARQEQERSPALPDFQNTVKPKPDALHTYHAVYAVQFFFNQDQVEAYESAVASSFSRRALNN